MTFHNKHPSSVVSDTSIRVLAPAYNLKDIAEYLEGGLFQTVPGYKISINDHAVMIRATQSSQPERTQTRSL